MYTRNHGNHQICYGASDPTVSDYEKYQTFARSIPPYSMMGQAVAKLFLHFNWNKVSELKDL